MPSTKRSTIKRSTLLALIEEFQGAAGTDQEIVAAITDLVNSGRVVLSGNFAGQRVTAARERSAL